MNNIFDYELYGDILRSPSSLEVGNENTTAKQMMEDRRKLTEILKMLNEFMTKLDVNENNVKSYYEKVSKLENTINNFIKGYTIGDNTITFNKLALDVKNILREWVIDEIHNTAKFVGFGLDENGYFKAYIPSSWSEIQFDTTEDGRLILREVM